MTVVYRAYSPSRDQATSPTDSQPYATGLAITRNQHDGPADWTVQAGTIHWETP